MAEARGWVPLAQNIWWNPKVKAAAKELTEGDVDAMVGKLGRLWAWALDNAEDGDLSNLSDRDLSGVMNTLTRPQQRLRKVLRSTRLIDSHDHINGWDEWAGELVEKRKKWRRKKRKQRKDKALENSVPETVPRDSDKEEESPVPGTVSGDSENVSPRPSPTDRDRDRDRDETATGYVPRATHVGASAQAADAKGPCDREGCGHPWSLHRGRRDALVVRGERRQGECVIKGCSCEQYGASSYTNASSTSDQLVDEPPITDLEAARA